MEPLRMKTNGMWASACDPRLLAQMRADTMNATGGDLTGYDCPRCRNRGVSYYINDALQLVSRECQCMDIRRSLRAINASGMGQRLMENTLDSFRAEEPWQQQMLELARRYLRQPDGWLLMCGQSGSGKTHLCSAVVRELMLRGHRARYMLWREESVKIKALAGDADRQEEAKAAFSDVPVLYIDDLFKTGGRDSQPTGADIGLAFELLNRRYVTGKRTVLSTELSLGQLMALDEALCSRILERAGDFVLEISPDRRKNYRLRHVQSC